jgi:hypothetical protein
LGKRPLSWLQHQAAVEASIKAKQEMTMTRTLTITAAAIGLLAAGVIGIVAASFNPAAVVFATVTSTNITAIAKNQAWPVKGLITMDPCAVAACQEV